MCRAAFDIHRASRQTLAFLLLSLGIALVGCERSASDGPVVAVDVVSVDGVSVNGGSVNGVPETGALLIADLEKSGPPNILFILADDLRWDALGAYGNTVVRTPNLDRLAAEGAKLSRFFVATPVCSPSRANFLTGLYAHAPGIEFFNRDSRFARARVREGTPTVATHLNSAGYVSGFIGKAHLGGDPRRWGFDVTPAYQPGFAFGEAPEKFKVLYVDGEPRPLPRDSAPHYADAAIEFLSAQRDAPWFLWLAFSAPHAPYDYHPEFPYDEADLQPPPGHPPEAPLTARPFWRGYYSEISALDAEVGRILDRLDALSLSENTLVIFTSDNGVMLGSHGISGKAIWYEESIRMPAIVRWPDRVQPGTEVAALVSSVDFLPTILDVAGMQPPPLLPGTSFLGALQGGEGAREISFAESYREKALGGGIWSMARDQRYKLVRIRGTEERHFYDLQEDPHEVNDLIAATSYRGEIDRLSSKLAAWDSGVR